MTRNNVDLVVIGIGSIGASVAYEAAKRGLRVALLDAGDIAGGTSCRSTKLLHGGVRYLELAFKTFDLAQLRLVQEALLERSHWLEQAPFLAHRIALILPSADFCSKAYYRLGLGLYDALSKDKSIGRSQTISSIELQQALPLLKKNSSGGVTYWDGQFNDARLNLLLALTAKTKGAIIRPYCKVIDFEKSINGKICGVISKNALGHHQHWETNAVVNATGIHADHLRQLADRDAEPRIFTSRGVHIVLDTNLCPQEKGLLVPSTDDGRVLFVLPFFGKTLVGTTDTPCKVDNAQIPSNQEKEYLINHLKPLFPGLGEPIIQSCWAGARPLIKPSKQALTSSRIIREHEIETLPCGLISAMGGKWTTCRTIALETLKEIETYIEESLPTPCHLPLSGTSNNPALTLSSLMEQRNELKGYLPANAIQEKQISHLQEQYGLKALEIIANSTQNEREPLSELIPLCQAEIKHAIKEEHAHTPTDVLARRCRIAMVNINEAKRILPLVQEELSRVGLPPGELDLQS